MERRFVSAVRESSYQHLPHLLAGCVFVAVRLNALARVPPYAPEGGDSQAYLRQASLPLWSASLWAGSRPPGIPLLYKLLGRDLWLIFAAQFLLAAIAWITLAAMVALVIRERTLKLRAFVLVLVFSSGTTIVRWEPLIMSEAISLSAFALLVAASLSLVVRWSTWRFAAWTAAALCWVAARDANGYLMAVLASGFALHSLATRAARTRALAAICLLLFCGSYASSQLGRRWYFPFINIVGQRILPDPSAKDWFIHHGMPASPALDQHARTWASSNDAAFYRDPELAEFHRWAAEGGRRTYLQYLAEHPASTLLDPLEDWQSVLIADTRGFYYPPLLSTWLTDTAELIAYPREPIWVIVWLLLALVIALVTSRRRGIEARHLVPLVLLLLVYPALFLVWHGDAMEIRRHGLQVAVQLRLGVWLLIIFCFDALADAVDTEE